jgi:hypothetical protein
VEPLDNGAVSDTQLLFFKVELPVGLAFEQHVQLVQLKQQEKLGEDISETHSYEHGCTTLWQEVVEVDQSDLSCMAAT